MPKHRLGGEPGGAERRLEIIAADKAVEVENLAGENVVIRRFSRFVVGE